MNAFLRLSNFVINLLGFEAARKYLVELTRQYKNAFTSKTITLCSELIPPKHPHDRSQSMLGHPLFGDIGGLMASERGPNGPNPCF